MQLSLVDMPIGGSFEQIDIDLNETLLLFSLLFLLLLCSAQFLH